MIRAGFCAVVFLPLLTQPSFAQPTPEPATLPPPASIESPPPTVAPPPPPPVSEGLGELFADSPLQGRGGGMGGFISPVVGQLLPRATYRAAWFPQESVKFQGTDLGYLQQDFSASVPLYQDSINEWAGTVHVRAESFDTNAILPNTQQPFPKELWNVHTGVNYRHLFDNGWIAGGGVSVGSASDKPFHSFSETFVGANAFLRIPQGEHNAWIFTLNLSSNSEVLPFIPIPGIAYWYAPSPVFQALIGFPFASLTYRPDEDWTVQLNYALLTNVRARITFLGLRPVRLYVAYDMANENYYRVGRPDDQDRFFYYDKTLSTGLQLPLPRFHALLDLSTGYVFNRYYFEGISYRDRGFNRLDISPGAFAALQLSFRF